MTENQASGLIDYLKHEMGYEVKIVKPFPWNKVITIVSGVVVAIPILKFSGPRLLATIRAPKLWIAITLVSVLLLLLATCLTPLEEYLTLLAMVKEVSHTLLVVILTKLQLKHRSLQSAML